MENLFSKMIEGRTRKENRKEEKEGALVHTGRVWRRRNSCIRCFPNRRDKFRAKVRYLFSSASVLSKRQVHSQKAISGGGEQNKNLSDSMLMSAFSFFLLLLPLTAIRNIRAEGMRPQKLFPTKKDVRL